MSIDTGTATRTWTVEIPAPAAMKSVNKQEHHQVAARYRRAWRETAWARYAAAKLPQGLSRIRVEVELRFTDGRKRDAPNYHYHVIKPIVDALQPERRVRNPKGGIRVERGWGVVPDDCAEFVELREPRMGPPVAKTRYPFGLVVLTITDLSEGSDV